MKQLKHFLLMAAMLMCSFAASGRDFMVNGIYYNITSEVDRTVEVTSNPNKYSYYKTVPTTVNYNGLKYRVTSIGKSAFSGCTSLIDITIPESVTSIGDDAFYNCSSLTAINIPEGVTSIGDHAFRDCISLTAINIPEGVTSIGYCAFYNCSGELTVNCNIPSASSDNYGAFSSSQFTKVTIGEGVTRIGDYAFYNCANLKEIIIEDGSEDLFLGFNVRSEGLFDYCPLEEVYLGRNLNYSSGQSPFYNKTKLTTLTIGESVTSIGDYAFEDCSSLTTITLPENSQLTSIGDYAFYKCSSLTSINIPESVKSIGYSAFSDCSSLTTITLPENSQLTIIGDYAFYKCSSLTAITIPDGVTSIGYCAFSDCSSLTAIVVAGENANYDSRIGCNAIIETNSNTLVVGCSSTTIPEGVTSIGDYAFSGCSSPVSITIPESVTSIGERAFEDCSGELTVNCNIPSASRYSNGAFYNSQFTKVTIGEGVTSIGDYAFAYCDSLTSITIPEKVTSIGEYAFRGCANLGKVINFSNLDIQKGGADTYAVIKIDEVVGDYCFCTLNGNVHSLSYYVGKKTALSLPEDYKGEDYTIGDYAFADNDEIVSVVIPSAASAIGNSAFAGCAKLASVTISRGMMIVGDRAFMDCANLSSVFLPQSVTSVGEKAFEGCSGMTSLSIGENVDDLKGNAFNGCTAVEVLTVKGSVMPVVPSSKLTSITLYSPVPLKTTEFATKVYRNAVVYVPQGSQARYQAADVWRNFWAIKEFDPTGIEGIKTTESVEAPIYDMKGMPISATRDSLPAGLYIQNGKKFVVM